MPRLLGLCLACMLVAPGCEQEPLSARRPSFEDGPLSGSTWVAQTDAWEITLELEGDLPLPSGSRVITGTLYSNRPECYLPSPLTATLAATNFESINRSQGESSDRSFIQLTGKLDPSELHAQVTVSVHAQDCDQQAEVAKRCQVVNEDMVFHRSIAAHP